jgi:hypothetical protein
MTSISFCITTGGTNDAAVQEVIDSVTALNIPTYEIIVVGGETTTLALSDIVHHVPFDENSKVHLTIYGHPGRWTTRKKNLGVQAAQHEVVVIMHDYVKFHADWYEEFEKFGTHWDVCVHQCLNYIGARSDGWRIDRYPGLPWACMVPYDMYDLAPYMAIQGNYAVVKREHFLKYPFDEDRLWGQAEEMEWSRRIVPNSYIRCNPNCIVQYTRPREWDQRHATDDIAQMNAHQHVFDVLRSCRIENHKLAGE